MNESQETQPKPEAGLPLGAARLLGVGDIVTVPIKNRWGIDCAATIEAVHESSVDATVWNMDGPGADRLVTGIPFDVITPNPDAARHRDSGNAPRKRLVRFRKSA